MKNINYIVVTVIILLGLGLSGIISAENSNSITNNSNIISGEDAAKILVGYLNLKTDGSVTLVNNSIQDKVNLYLLKVNYKNQDIPVYITKDGKYFVQGINLINDTSSMSNDSQPQVVPKTDVPEVELFVFSYCPYGLQFEKALFPVYDLLKDKANIKIEYIGAMHGDFEHKETLRQICIQKNYGNDKLFSYLKEFDMSASIGNCNAEDKCLTFNINKIYNNLDINKEEIESCMDNDAQNIYDKQNKKAEELGIQGSPTFLINDVEVSVARNPAAIKDALCNSFSITPDECDIDVSSESASPGFGKYNYEDINKELKKPRPIKRSPHDKNDPVDIPPINIIKGNNITNTLCLGCKLDDKCYPFGFRKDNQYCDDKNSTFIIQKNPNLNCENNFECDSNLCINSSCVSGSSWQKFLNWFSDLFGKK